MLGKYLARIYTHILLAFVTCDDDGGVLAEPQQLAMIF